MTTESVVTFSRRIAAPAAEVFRAFVHPTLLRDWLANAADSEQRTGGYIFLRWNDGDYACGTFTRFEPPARLEFTWDGMNEPGVSRVEVEIEAQGESALLTVRHAGLGQGPAWEAAIQGFEHGWTEGLENLQSVLETGIDLRLARRPRLGIYIDEFNAEIAAKLGVPVDRGICLGGTAENTGARAAGLQKGDVLVSLNGVALVGMGSFDEALHGLQAGDRPAVVFYRGAQQHTVALELSRYPIPELPESALQLREKVLALQAEIETALDSVFAGKSEVQAGRAPAAGEWNARELLAHMILCERDYQGWVADMLNDTPGYDDFRMRPNVTGRIRALTARLSTVAALREEFGLAQAETAALIEALPEEFVRWRKHLFRRAAYWALDVTRSHLFDEHLEQFNTALTHVGPE